MTMRSHVQPWICCAQIIWLIDIMVKNAMFARYWKHVSAQGFGH